MIRATANPEACRRGGFWSQVVVRGIKGGWVSFGN